MSIEFEFELGQEVWFINDQGVADKSKIHRCVYDLSATRGYSERYYLENGLDDKPAHQIFKSPDALAREIFSSAGLSVIVGPPISSTVTPNVRYGGPPIPEKQSQKINC